MPFRDMFIQDLLPLTDGFWSNFSYTHSPVQQITAERLADWVKTELLGGSPFETEKVPVPLKWDNTPGLDELQYVGYTRRQLCYIVAKILIGSDTLKFQNGLKAFLDSKGPKGCIPRADGFGRSFWTLLASCYADPTLGSGQGPMIVISKGSQQVVSAELLQGGSQAYKLSAAKLKICRYDDGSDGSPLPGMAMVNASRCQAGGDFMSADTAGGQAMQVMTQGLLGGRLLGMNCNFGGGQSEHMAFVMPEVAALSFFLSDANSTDPQIHTPVWVVGARPLFDMRDATIWSTPNPRPFQAVLFSSDLVKLQLGTRTIQVSNSKPVVAFSAETEEKFGDLLSREEVKLARTNRLGTQRNSSKAGALSFGNKVLMYYRGMSLATHRPEIAPLLKKVVKSVGVGPWGAGLSFGDSTLGFLAMWIGHAAAAGTWEEEIPDLEYYIYSSFVENPSNQCLVHSNRNCQKCISQCHEKHSTNTYWLPHKAFLLRDNNPCLTGKWHECSMHGIEHVHWNWRDASAGHLWQEVAYMIWKHRKKSDRSIFDELMEFTVSRATQKLSPIFPKAEVYS